MFHQLIMPGSSRMTSRSAKGCTAQTPVTRCSDEFRELGISVSFIDHWEQTWILCYRYNSFQMTLLSMISIYIYVECKHLSLGHFKQWSRQTRSSIHAIATKGLHSAQWLWSGKRKAKSQGLGQSLGKDNITWLDHVVSFQSHYSTRMIYVLFPTFRQRGCDTVVVLFRRIMIDQYQSAWKKRFLIDDWQYCFQISVHDHWMYELILKLSPIVPQPQEIVGRQGEAAQNMPRRTRPLYSVHPQFP
jgi:hypothetical protein